MKNLNDIDLKRAEAAYAVANTPMFLIRKLRSDRTVQTIADRCSAADLYTALRSSLEKKPETLSDVVKPYAYAVALFQKGAISYLRKAKELRFEQFNWFGQVVESLLKMHMPTSVEVVNFPRPLTKIEKTQTSDLSASSIFTVPSRSAGE